MKFNFLTGGTLVKVLTKIRECNELIEVNNFFNKIEFNILTRLKSKIGVLSGGNIIIPSSLNSLRNQLERKYSLNGVSSLKISSLNIKDGSKTYFVTIKPIVLGLKQGDNIFSYFKYKKKLESELSFAANTAMSARSLKVERVNNGDSDLKKIKYDRKKLIFYYEGKPIYSNLHRMIPYKCTSLFLSKIQYSKNSKGEIFVDLTHRKPKKIKAGMPSFLERYQLVKKGDRYYFRFAEFQPRQPIIRSTEDIMKYKDYINKYFADRLAFNAIGFIFGLIGALDRDSILKPVFKHYNSISFFQLLKLTNLYCTLLGINRASKKSFSMHATLEFISKTGGKDLINMLPILPTKDTQSEDLASHIPQTTQDLNKYLKLWNYIKNSSSISGFNKKELATYTNMKFLFREPNISEVLRGLTKFKHLHLYNDRSIIVMTAREYNKGRTTVKQAYKNIIKRRKEAEKIDPLSPIGSQKIRIISLSDTDILTPNKNFYLRRAITGLYGENKLADYYHQEINANKKEKLDVKKFNQQIKMAVQNNDKLLIYVSAHGAEKGGKVNTSIGNIHLILKNALSQISDRKKVEKFIRSNLVLGTNQCFGAELIRLIKQHFKVEPRLMFTETTAKDSNMNYPDYSHRIPVASKFERVFTDKVEEYLKNRNNSNVRRAHWTKFDGTKVYKKPTIIRIMNYIDTLDRSLDVHMHLNHPSVSKGDKGVRISSLQRKRQSIA
ncbi:hypothetical protein KKG71_04575 [Patescibacteria group bacterium]|nr:hypothetical protein [Patescibacteria group bacterium]